MLGFIVRLFLALAGEIAAFFVARDALNFEVIQMVIGMFLFTFVIMIFGFWSELKKFFKGKNKL